MLRLSWGERTPPSDKTLQVHYEHLDSQGRSCVYTEHREVGHLAPALGCTGHMPLVMSRHLPQPSCLFCEWGEWYPPVEVLGLNKSTTTHATKCTPQS